MAKKILAVLMGLAMSVMLVSPAFAAELTSAEQKVLGEFKTELEYWKANAGLDQAHVDQYYNEAKSALVAVDLSDQGCADFSEVVKQIHQVFVNHNCKTRHELWECYPEIRDIINKVGDKYYNLEVTLDANPGGHWAKVTWEIPTTDPKTGETTTKKSAVADTKTVVKQTGFGIGQTLAVVAASAGALGIAFVVARKKQLFVA